jgi:hypothetical protein
MMQGDHDKKGGWQGNIQVIRKFNSRRECERRNYCLVLDRDRPGQWRPFCYHLSLSDQPGRSPTASGPQPRVHSRPLMTVASIRSHHSRLDRPGWLPEAFVPPSRARRRPPTTVVSFCSNTLRLGQSGLSLTASGPPPRVHLWPPSAAMSAPTHLSRTGPVGNSVCTTASCSRAAAFGKVASAPTHLLRPVRQQQRLESKHGSAL